MAYATTADLSYAPPQDYDPAYAQPTAVTINAAPEDSSWFLKRSVWLPLPFLVPVALCGVSWAGNGIPFLTDLGFIFLAALCSVFLVVEMLRFPRRFGTGGMVIFGGVLIWYCHDFFYKWFSYDGHGVFPAWVIAKTAFLVSLITFSMVVGLNIRGGRWLTRVVCLVPEAKSGGFYACLLVALCAIGLLPYFLFVNEAPHLAIYHDIIGMRGSRAAWTVGRSGDYNYNWGAYALHFLDVGYFAGMFGSFYATLVARRLPGQVLGWAVCVFWTLMAFGSGTRGYVVGVVVPAMGFLYIKYHVDAAARMRRMSVKAYVATISLTLLILVLVQLQATYRNARLDRWGSWDKVEVGKPQGNHMFSEGLLAAQTVPAEVPYFANRFIGEGPVRIIPDLVISCILHPIPRALWPTKPHDAALDWYNRRFTGERRAAFTTTIAPGVAVAQYMRYGTVGMAIFGVVFGWLLGCSERVLRSSGGRPVQVLVSLAMAVWLFRCFRGGLGWMEFYALVIGFVAMSGLVVVTRPLFARAD